MEENRRNFLSANLTENMLAVIKNGGYVILPEASSIQELKGIENLFVSIKNPALLGTLKKLGVNPKEEIQRFQVNTGDTLYVVSAHGILLRDYKEDAELPETCTLSVTKYKIERNEK